MSSIVKYYAKSNKICPFCNNEVTLKQVLNNETIYSETKRKTRLFAHRSCVERGERKWQQQIK